MILITSITSCGILSNNCMRNVIPIGLEKSDIPNITFALISTIPSHSQIDDQTKIFSNSWNFWRGYQDARNQTLLHCRLKMLRYVNLTSLLHYKRRRGFIIINLSRLLTSIDNFDMEPISLYIVVTGLSLKIEWTNSIELALQKAIMILIQTLHFKSYFKTVFLRFPKLSHFSRHCISLLKVSCSKTKDFSAYTFQLLQL